MATLKTIQCRNHGGSFMITPRRGRPPVKCTEENPCDMVSTRKKSATAAAKRTAETLQGKMPKRPGGGRRPSEIAMAAVEREEPAKKATRSRPEAGPVTVRHNPSVPLARHAREHLEPLGWECKGRGWFDPRMDSGTAPDEAWTEVVATRGTETLILRWKDGKLDSQSYLVWDGDKAPAGNGKPRSRLPFDPNEMTDSELIKAISGQKITWWNRIAKSSESAIVPGEKIQIEHTYSGTGDESLRIVKFVDLGQGGFRAFHVEAMMKIG